MKYTFRNPKHHIIDIDPLFKEELKSCSSQNEARYLRNIYMWRYEQMVKSRLDNDNPEEQEELSLFSLQ